MTDNYYEKYMKYKKKYMIMKGGTCTINNDATIVDLQCNKIIESNPYKGSQFLSSNKLTSSLITHSCSTFMEGKKTDFYDFLTKYNVDIHKFPPKKMVDYFITLNGGHMTIYGKNGNDGAISLYHNKVLLSKDSDNYNNFLKYNKMITSYKPTIYYPTLNDFFKREIYLLHDDAVNMINNINENKMISPACCRCTIFLNIQQARNAWIKGSQFSLSRLLNTCIKSNGCITKDHLNQILNQSSGVQSLSSLGHLFEHNYNGVCSIVISRLSPQDYHCIHMPLSGTVLYIDDIKGSYVSVQPDNVHRNDVYDINRRINIWMYNDKVGVFIICLIGSTCVGSIQLYPYEDMTQQKITIDNLHNLFTSNSNIHNGSESLAGGFGFRKKEYEINDKKVLHNPHLNDYIGKKYICGQIFANFEFGGSTVVTIIPKQNDKNSILLFNQQILNNSCNNNACNPNKQIYGIETLVTIGEHISTIQENSSTI